MVFPTCFQFWKQYQKLIYLTKFKKIIIMRLNPGSLTFFYGWPHFDTLRHIKTHFDVEGQNWLIERSRISGSKKDDE